MTKTPPKKIRKVKGYAVLRTSIRRNLKICQCHPSGQDSYTIYLDNPRDFDPYYPYPVIPVEITYRA